MSRASDLANLIAGGSTTIQGEAGVTSSDSTGKTTNLQQGLAKVWVNFDGTLSTLSPRDSLNVSGLLDNGAGDYTVSYTNDMNNSDYSAQVTGTLTDSGVTSSSTPFNCRSLAASSMRAIGVGTNNTGLDMFRMCVANHGDLA